MTTLSVPLPADLAAFVEDMVAEHKADSKAGVVRRALYKLRDDEFWASLAEAEKDVREGKVFRGDLRKLVAACPDYD